VAPIRPILFLSPQNSNPVFSWYELGGRFVPYIFYQLFNLLGMTKIDAALWGFQTVSILSGGAFVYLSFKTVELITDDTDDKLAFLFMIWFTGFVFLFFGFIEQTPLIFLAGLFFIDQIFRYNVDPSRKRALYLLAIVIVGIVIDIYFLTTLPVVLYILVKTLIKRRQIGSFAGSLLAYISIIAGVSTLYALSIGDIFLEKYLLYLGGKQPETYYSIFSGAHLADLFNLVYYASPIFIAMILAIAMRIKFYKEDKIFSTLGILVLSQFIALFIFDPINGIARDHHNYFFLILGFVYLGAYSMLKLKENKFLSKDIFMAFSPVALLAILPMLAVHLNFPMTEKYLDDYLNKNDYKYESALYAFRDYHYIAKEYDAADKREQSIRSKAPGILESNLINDLYAHQRIDEAMEYALRLSERFPYNPTYKVQKGNLLRHFRKYREAENEYLTAMRLDKNRPETYHFLSEIYRDLNIKSKCKETILSGLEIASNNRQLLLDLTAYFYREGKYSAVDSLCVIILESNPDEPYVFMYRGLVAEGTKRLKKALGLYERFVELNENLPEVGIIRKRINDLYLILNDTTSQ